MVSRPSKGTADKQNWQSFIEFIKISYQNDDLVEIKSDFLEFKAGEYPRLPLEGHKFLRFSSKVSASHAKGVEKYIDTVTWVARAHSGSRVHYWNEAADRGGFYSWQEANDSLDSYEQVGYDTLEMSRVGF